MCLADTVNIVEKSTKVSAFRKTRNSKTICIAIILHYFYYIMLPTWTKMS